MGAALRETGELAHFLGAGAEPPRHDPADREFGQRFRTTDPEAKPVFPEQEIQQVPHALSPLVQMI